MSFIAFFTSTIIRSAIQSLFDNQKEIRTANLHLKNEIKERKRAEEELRKNEEKFRFLTENVPDIVWTLDVDFNTTFVSPSIEKILGVTSEERKSQPLEKMMTPNSLERAEKMFFIELGRDKESSADSERSVKIEVEYYHKNGSIVWM